MQRSASDYQVGWICALPLELAAAEGMLDEIHDPLPQQGQDQNQYTHGHIGHHNVVIACLPAGNTGIAAAAHVANHLHTSFRNLKSAFLIGIGGGVPGPDCKIRLGDVVVSQASGSFGGVVQYTFGKTEQGGIFHRTGYSNSPPTSIMAVLSKLQAKHRREGHKIEQNLEQMFEKYSLMRSTYTSPGDAADFLFEADYDHPEGNQSCLYCDQSRLVQKQARTGTKIKIHYGNIASGDQVMRHGITRNRLSDELEVICFEMEAAGLMKNYPCIVIRGICDYADSHKNNQWQEHAAAVAAAYAKELLYEITAHDVVRTSSIQAEIEHQVNLSPANQDRQPFSSSDSHNGHPLPQLVLAASLDDFQSFYRIFQADPDIHVREPLQGRTPLHMAAVFGRQAILETLISAGAEIDAETFDGTTPLAGACIHGHFTIVCSLLDAGANINATAKSGYNVLFGAVANRRSQIVRLLVQRGADTTVRVGGWAVLDIALRAGDRDTISALHR